MVSKKNGQTFTSASFELKTSFDLQVRNLFFEDFEKGDQRIFRKNKKKFLFEYLILAFCLNFTN